MYGLRSVRSDGDEWWVEAKEYGRQAKARLKAKQAKQFLQEVLDHFGFDDTIGVYSGQWKSVHCPFHADRRKSASVSSTYFRCHGCDMSGDAVDLVMKELGLEFREALEYIEEHVL